MLVLEGEHPVARLAFTPDGTRLVVTRAASMWSVAEVRVKVEVWPSEVWTLATATCIPLPTPTEVERYPSFAVHPSGRFAFFVQGRSLSVVSLAAGTAREVASGEDFEVLIASPNGKWLVATNEHTNLSGERFFSYQCDVGAKPTCEARWQIAPKFHLERLGGFIGTGDQFITAAARRIIVRDTATGAVRSEARHHADTAIQPVVSPDGSRLAFRSYSQFYIWDITTWKKQAQIGTENRPFVEYTFHPTKPILAAIQSGQTLVKYLDSNTAQPVRKFQWKLGAMRCVCFSPDGTLAAAGSTSGKIVVWDVDD